MKTLFYVPTQVKFKVTPDFCDEENNPWAYGIAYNGTIICACCGTAFSMDEICEIIELPWYDFSDKIKE